MGESRKNLISFSVLRDWENNNNNGTGLGGISAFGPNGLAEPLRTSNFSRRTAPNNETITECRVCFECCSL